jgi:hypothetical protein
MSAPTLHARPGDLVVVEHHRVGETGRLGEILAVLGVPPHERYRVRWDDGRESIFYPSNDTVIRPGSRGRRPAAQTPAATVAEAEDEPVLVHEP